MDMSMLERYLEGLAPEELDQAERVIAQVKTAKTRTDKTLEEQGQAPPADAGGERRSENRFTTEIPGTVTRLTNVRPGEKKEFTATILDISRTGMRLKTDLSFVPSRVVRVTFSAPGGNIKQCCMQIMRYHQVSQDDDKWLELGCAAVAEDEVASIHLQEAAATKMRQTLTDKSRVYIYVVGAATPETKNVSQLIKAEGYQVRCIDSVRQAVEQASKTQAQLAIFCQGTQLVNDGRMLAEVAMAPPSLAMLAVIEDEEGRFKLFHAGIEEYILTQDVEALLFHMIERALVGNAVRQRQDRRDLSSKALLITADNVRADLLNFQLEKTGFSCSRITNTQELGQLGISDYDLALADFDPDDCSEFNNLRAAIADIPLIALCPDHRVTSAAQAAGADDYLCVPASEGDIRVVIERLSPAEKQLVK